MYSPTMGRFLQTDPIGYEDQFNLYAYVGNDPVNGTDFTGLQEDDERDFIEVTDDSVSVKSLVGEGATAVSADENGIRFQMGVKIGDAEYQVEAGISYDGDVDASGILRIRAYAGGNVSGRGAGEAGGVRLEARTEQPDPGQLAREQAGHDAAAGANRMSSPNRSPRTKLQKAATALEVLFRALNPFD